MKKITLLSIGFLFYLQSYSQVGLPTVTPPMPEAAALSRYADVPISLYTGTPQIDIPLYNLKCGDLSLPVSLSYYASGIKVEDISTTVGVGWSLNTGGLVSRTIRGQQADDPSGTNTNLPIPYNPTSTDFNNVVDMASGNVDTETDIFYYNFNGYSGSFSFKGTKVVFRKYDDIKIVPILGGPLSVLTGFTITVKDGTKYYFEYGASPAFAKGTTEWYLTKIVNVNATDSIRLEYQAGGGYIVPPRNSKYYFFNTTNTTPYLIYNTGLDVMYHYDNKGIIPKKIYTSNNDSIVFITKQLHYDETTTNSNQKAIDSVLVYNSGNKRIKSFKLGTNNVKTIKPYTTPTIELAYPVAGSDYTMNYRLYLDDITERGNNGETINHHFEYYGRTPDGKDSLPNSLSFAQDMGGYYNGIDTNKTLRPTFNDVINPFVADPLYSDCIDYRFPHDVVTIPGANRVTDFICMRMGTLKSIQYPTGGKTMFSYSQKALNPPGGAVWGLNVDTIKYFDSNGHLLKRKHYEYSQGTLGHNIPSNVAYTYYSPDLGVMSFSPRCDVASPSDPDYQTFKTAIEISPGPKEDLGLFEGPLVGYGHVEEIEDGNGKTVYEYQNDDGATEALGHQIQAISSFSGFPVTAYNFEVGDFWPLGPFPDNSWKRGILLSKTIYKQTDPDNFLQKTSYNYSFIPLDTIPEAKFYTAIPFGFYFYYQYNYIGSRIKLNSVTETLNGITTTTSYQYNNSSYLSQKTKETTNQSDGSSRSIEYKYPYDFSSVLPYTTMVNSYMIAPVIEQTERRNGKMLQTIKTNYDSFQGNTIIAPSLITTQKDSLIYAEPRVKYLAYDSKGNVQSVSKAGGPKVNYIYGYGGNYPIAQVVNADYSAIVAAFGSQTAIDSFRDNSSPSDATVNTFLAPLRNRSFFPNAQVTTYTYKPLVGMTSITDARGNTTYYEYDSFQRLVNVKDQYGNIKTHYCYNYAGQSVDCKVIAATPPAN